jgi:hypothetical protein
MGWHWHTTGQLSAAGIGTSQAALPPCRALQEAWDDAAAAHPQVFVIAAKEFADFAIVMTYIMLLLGAAVFAFFQLSGGNSQFLKFDAGECTWRISIYPAHRCS